MDDLTIDTGLPGLEALEDCLVTKAGSLFAVCDRTGDIDAAANPSHGLYFHDTRFLSRSTVRVNGERPLLLRWGAWNGDRSLAELRYGNIAIRRERILDRDIFERLDFQNLGPEPVALKVELEFAVDYQSIFVVRGAAPGRRGRMLAPSWQGRTLHLRYQGADRRRRGIRLQVAPTPTRCLPAGALYALELPLGARTALSLRGRLRDLGPGPMESEPEPTAPPTSTVRVSTSNPAFDLALQRSLSDLRILTTRTEQERFFAAGIPWFVALFGRDSIISALQALAFDPGVAASTLRLLAAHQGRRFDARRDEEPGKILHELRLAEDANLGEVPHQPYYGSADATPLFLILLAEYVRWTGDRRLWQELRGNADRALDWLLSCGDHDGDGFIDYQRGASRGLFNQGWKDSGDAIVHRDGSLAEPPIAPVEVQAYAHRALRELAWLKGLDGDRAGARELEREAAQLRRRFRQAYWMPHRRYLALALAAGGRRVETVTSNAGHAFWGGIVEPEIASALVRRLLAPDLFSGWGIRTLSRRELAYDPDNYQVGAVWPHDNSLIVAGLCRYGFVRQAERAFAGIFAAACSFPGSRLPELFGGQSRGRRRAPVAYPVACNPQAWAAGSLPYMLTSILGLQPDAPRGRLRIRRPALPDWLERVRLSGVRVGETALDLEYWRQGRLTKWSARFEGGPELVIS